MNVVRQMWERDCAEYLQRLVDNNCKSCTYRERCDRCDISRAKVLRDRYAAIRQTPDAPIPQRRDSHLKNRYREIVAILRRAGRPLRAREIVLRSTVSRNVKWWTLRRMVAKGIVRKTAIRNIYGNREAAYYLPSRKNAK